MTDSSVGSSKTVLDSFQGMFNTLFVASTVGISVGYALASVVACVVSKPQRLWTYPVLVLSFIIYGLIVGVFSSFLPSVILAAIYMSIPQTLDSEVAITYGIAMAVLFLYIHLGRAIQ